MTVAEHTLRGVEKLSKMVEWDPRPDWPPRRLVEGWSGEWLVCIKDAIGYCITNVGSDWVEFVDAVAFGGQPPEWCIPLKDNRPVSWAEVEREVGA